MEQKERIRNAYRGLGGKKTFYDGMITCMDYSPEMLERAKHRGAGQSNVCFQQGDVGNLPFEDGSFDTVLSLNGFHAFPDKETAWKEIFRY